MALNVIIAGGGISGLSLACALMRKNPAMGITVLEAEGRPGGKIWTERVHGFLCEAGVNGFLDNKPATLELSSMLGISPIKSNDSARKRAIFLPGGLRMIPASPGAFLLSDFLSLKGRLRMVGEYFVPKKIYEDESMEDFALRRVGREFFEKLLDPMASGVYAGNPSEMSIRSCFNKVYELERTYGGLIKGFMALGRQARKSGKKMEAGPGGTLMSFSDGMFSLVDVLRHHLGDRIRTGTPVATVEKTSRGYRVICRDGSSYEGDVVVVATPAHNTATILGEIDKGICGMLATIPYPPVAVVALGYRRDKIPGDTSLFGYLVPKKAGRKILGTLFDSSIYPNRAPEGQVLLRTIVGGARAPEIALLDDDRLVETVRSELSDILGIRADPEMAWTYRWEKAIPQYLVGHHEKLTMLDDTLRRHPGLYLHGNAYRGVAVNDCIGNSFSLADRIAPAGGC